MLHVASSLVARVLTCLEVLRKFDDTYTMHTFARDAVIVNVMMASILHARGSLLWANLFKQ